MTPAAYFASGTVNHSEYHHYGLAAPVYTHFTSPIRRYADVVVHRLLAATIGAATLPNQLTQKHVKQTCDNINRRHRMAQMASRDSTRIHTLNFLNKNTFTEEARIISLKQNGFQVLIPRYGLEGKVYLCSGVNSSELWTYNEKEQSISNQGVVYRIFDKVLLSVSLDTSRAHSRKVILRICENNSASSSSTVSPSSSLSKADVKSNISTIPTLFG